jgi:uroporphyrinogen-III decarboxylase
MTGRERINTVLDHKEADKVPVDCGATTVTGIHVTCVADLRRHYGLEQRPVKVVDAYQMLGEVEADLRDILGIDTVGVLARKGIFGFANENWKPWRTPWNQEVLVPEKFVTSPAPDGGVLIHPQGDSTAPASGHMPARGYFFDTIIRQEPFDEEDLKVEDNLEEFTSATEADLNYFAVAASEARATRKAVVATFGGTAFGDIALVPAPFLTHPRGIRDIEEWYISISTRPDFVRAIFEKQCEIAIQNLEKITPVVEDHVDVVFICGTDFGTQISQFCSVDTFREVYKPFYQAVNGWIHKNTNWKTFKHTCGAVRPFIPELIEAGFDILNPVQCSATGMGAEELKRDFGSEITFWGGGVDTQKTLPFGTPEQVRREVLERCEILSRGGGFVFNSIHNLQARTPVENLVAMFDAVKEFNS